MEENIRRSEQTRCIFNHQVDVEADEDGDLTLGPSQDERRQTGKKTNDFFEFYITVCIFSVVVGSCIGQKCGRKGFSNQNGTLRQLSG